jgi:octaprenyl-diphosphate synthase
VPGQHQREDLVAQQRVVHRLARLLVACGHQRGEQIVAVARVASPRLDDRIDDVVAAIESTGSIAYTARKAEDEAELARQAIATIPDSPCKQALLDLAHFSVNRDY